MGFDLTNEAIQNTYQQLVQISGSTLVDGTGSAVAFSTPSSSYADYAVTASYALNVPTIDTSSLTPLSTFNAYTSSNDASVASKLPTSTFNTYTSSVDSSLAGKLETTTFNAYTSSNDSVVNALVAATSSYLTSIPSGVVSSSAQTVSNLVGQVVSVDTINAESASIGHINYVTGSATIIGDAFIVLNTDSPSLRYAGLKVVDSGSLMVTSSLEWDSDIDTWIAVEETQNTAVMITGPTGSRGSETFTTVNKLQKGLGYNYIGDSIVTDDGSKVSIAGNLELTGNFRTLTATGIGASISGFNTISATNTISAANGDVVIGNYSTTFGLVRADATNSPSGLVLANDSSLTNNILIDSTYTSTDNSMKVGKNFVGGGAPTVSGNRRFVFANGSSTSADDSVILGGESNDISSGFNAMFGTSGTTISSGDLSVVVGGYQHTINGGARNVTIGGESVTNNQDYAIVLGRKSFTTPSPYTTYVAGLDVSGSAVVSGSVEVTGQIYSPTFAGSIASSTSSIDFDNGNFATLSLTSGTHIANPSNLKSGTTYTIIISSGSLIDSMGSAFKWAGGTAPTFSNGTDVLTMVSDGTNLYATALTDFQ